MLEIVPVPVLADNYVWLMHDAASGETVAIDPGVADPVLAAAAARGWTIGQVWTTHWHPDHTGGNDAVKAATGCTISGPAYEAAKIPTLDVRLREGERVRIGAHEAVVWHVPGHTAGHIAFHLAEAEVIFVGDTLFAMGCGRLFEGSAAEMHANFQRLATLPEATRAYAAHEYTLANARFAAHVDPDNEAVKSRLAETEQARADGRPTLPTTIGAERATNPFMRASSAEIFATLRAAKDGFAG